MALPIPKPHLSRIQPYVAGRSSKNATITPIKLSSNENPYGPSPKAIEAYQHASQYLHRYPDGSAEELRHTIAETHKLSAKQIICGAGSDELISLIIHAYAGAGDEVLFTEHAFLMYRIYTVSAGATPIEAKETNLRTDVNHIIDAVTERTKIIFIANPNNPTGSYLTKEELTDLRKRLPSHILLVVDGAYAECADAPDYACGQHLATTTQNTVTLRTFSKLYGLPNLRLGWMYGDTAIIDAVGRIKSPFNISGAAQIAGIAAMKDQPYISEQFSINKTQRQWLADALATLNITTYPSQGNFVLANLESHERSTYVVSELEKRYIYIRDVKGYKLPHYARISIGTVQENKTLIEALNTIVK